MTIETIGLKGPVFRIDDQLFAVNLKEYENFINNCQKFMDTDPDSMMVMTQVISDQIIDSVGGEIKIDDIRPQLKFLREVGFFLKEIVVPITDQDQG